MRRLSLAIGRATSWLILIAVGVTLFEVLMRYLLDRPTSWAHALATLLCAVAFALGGAFALARDEHVRIGVVYDKLGRARRRLVDLLGFALGAFYLAGLGLGLWDQAVDAVWRFDWDGNWDPERTPGPPNWPLPAALRVALLLGTALFLGLLLRLAFSRPGRG